MSYFVTPTSQASWNTPVRSVRKQSLARADTFTTRQRDHVSPACSVGVENFFHFYFL